MSIFNSLFLLFNHSEKSDRLCFTDVTLTPHDIHQRPEVMDGRKLILVWESLTSCLQSPQNWISTSCSNLVITTMQCYIAVTWRLISFVNYFRRSLHGVIMEKWMAGKLLSSDHKTVSVAINSYSLQCNWNRKNNMCIGIVLSCTNWIMQCCCKFQLTIHFVKETAVPARQQRNSVDNLGLAKLCQLNVTWSYQCKCNYKWLNRCNKKKKRPIIIQHAKLQLLQ